jgi:hypothetical protein
MAHLAITGEGFSFGRLWNDKDARSFFPSRPATTSTRL